MIRYLKQEEKKNARAMYEAAFPEDSKEFADYYFAEKIKDNQILVMEEGKRLQVMIHLNPYIFSICGETVEVNYVVAVATDAAVRKQGRMAQVMKQALQDMARAHQPFTFLIPANYRVYESGGFAFVPSEKYTAYEKLLSSEGIEKEADLQAAELGKTGLQRTGSQAADFQTAELQAAELGKTGLQRTGSRAAAFHPATERDIPQMVRFSNEILAQEYDVFPRRTTEYYQRMLAELASQNGELVLIERRRECKESESDLISLDRKSKAQEDSSGEQRIELTGIFSYGKEEEHVELQEILLASAEREYFKNLVTSYFKGLSVQITKMDFMVRILDLRVLGLLLRSEEPFSIKVQVQDDIIAENCGCFEIKADRMGSSITVILQKSVDCSMDITELTRFLFGKLKLFIREWV